ncbi:MAG TPA: Trp family transcriptional regulator [Patescibacteria group bacterium]|nr:Trp family transcriptional regulator [Patescibacteria group bacterium]
MNDKYLDSLIEVLMSIGSRGEMLNFLQGIFTPKELVEIPTRLEIVKMLKSGVAQHEIAEKLGVGIATVTRGSKEIKKGRFKNV